MEKQIMLVLTCLVLVCGCKPANVKEADAGSENRFDEAVELDSIMMVIDAETKSFFAGDYEAWAKTWSHQPYTAQAWNNSDGTADAAIGWEQINAQGKNWIETYYKNGAVVIHPDYKRSTPMVKFFNDKTAYVTWEQWNADDTKEYYRKSREMRIMEKESDGWKIVNVSAFWDTDPKVHADSMHIK